MSSTILTPGDSAVGVALSAGNDGTMVLQAGTVGAKVDAVVLAASGQATLKQPPKLDTAAVVSMIRLHTANGYGSTATSIKRYLTQVTNTGADITYADSASAGASFTINTAGIYCMSITASGATTVYLGVSLNSSQLTTAIYNITAADRLTYSSGNGGNPGFASASVYLPAGSVIRPHCDGAATGGASSEQFTITRIG